MKESALHLNNRQVRLVATCSGTSIVRLSLLLTGLIALQPAQGATRWVLVYYRQMGNQLNGGTQTIENHVFNEDGTKASSIGVTNQFNSGSAVFGSTDSNGWNRINPLDFANCTYDIRIYNPSVATDQSPSFYWQHQGGTPSVYSYVTQWMKTSDDTRITAYPTTPVYHYDNVSGLNHADSFGANCSPVNWTEAPNAGSDTTQLGTWATYQAQTFTVPAGINRIVSAQAFVLRGAGENFVYRAQIREGGPTGTQIGPTATSRVVYTGEFKEAAVSWGINDIPVSDNGQVYALYLDAADGQGFNVYRTTTDIYPNGCAYHGTTQKAGKDLVAVIVGVGYNPSGSPTITRTPTTLSASCTAGTNATSQSFIVKNTGTGTLNYTISDNQTWLSETPTTGTGTGEDDTITVNYATSGLSAGTYNATITITDANATNNPQTIPVTLTVTSTTPPAITLAPSTLSPSCTAGANAASQSFTVQNTGGGTLSYTISDDQTWLSQTPTTGTSTGEADTITVNYSTSGLAAGTYNATITVTDANASNNPQTIPVTLTVEAAGVVTEDFETVPTWSSSFNAAWGSSATWSAVAGGQSNNALQATRASEGSSAKVKVYSVVASTNYTISVYMKCPNYAGGSYWGECGFKLGSNTASDYDSNSATWTEVNKFSDTGTNGNGNTWTKYAVSCFSGTDTQISIGFKHGAVSNTGPTILWDTLRVVENVTPPTITLVPASLSPSCTQGSNATSQSFTIQNTGGGTLSYTVSDDQTWLSQNPTTGTSTGEADTITVNYSTSGLAVGTYNATITVTDSNASNNPQTIPVTLTVLAKPTITRSPATLSPTCIQGTNATSQSFTIQNTGGQTLSYTISDDQTWLSETPTSGTSTGEVDTITVNYSTSSLGVGTYNATITITDANASNNPQTIAVTLTVTAKPTITRSPSTLTPSCAAGTDATSQSFTIQNTGGSTLSYTISDDQTWLSETPTSGTSTGEVDTITVDYATSGLSAGTYNATITISDANATNNPQTIAVTLTVKATVAEDFSTVPTWTSSFNAAWGNAATWSSVSGGQSGNALQATRSGTGSSDKVKVYTITANASYTISIYMKASSSTESYWRECFFKLGSNTASDYDSNAGTWTEVKKFSNTGTNGNSNTWTQYSATFNSGANTQISVGFKTGNSTGTAPTILWDTLRIQ